MLLAAGARLFGSLVVVLCAVDDAQEWCCSYKGD
jgi:hypothetical protein